MSNVINPTFGMTPKFQAGILSLLLTDSNFMMSIVDYLEIGYFDAGEIYIKLLKLIKMLHVKYKTKGLTVDIVKNVLQQLQTANKLSEGDCYGMVSVLDLGQQLTPSEKEFIRTNVYEFIKRQTIAIAFSNAITSYEKNDYESVYSIMNKAFKNNYGMENSLGTSYFESNIHDRYSTPPRDGIWPTRFTQLNKFIGGGLAKKEAATVISSSGRGKTAILCNFAVDAVLAEKRTAFVTLEMADKVIEQRVDAVISGWSPAELSNSGEARIELDQHIKRMKKSQFLQIKEFVRGSLTSGQLRTYLDKLIHETGGLDVLILDWLGCMKMGSTVSGGESKRHEQLAEAADDLVNISREYALTVLTAHQSNRSAVGNDKFSYNAVSESFASLFGLDLVLGLGATDQSKDSGYRYLSILKNRMGPDSVGVKLRGNLPNQAINFRFEEVPDDQETELVTSSSEE